MDPTDARKILARVRFDLGLRLTLRPYESIKSFKESDQHVAIVIETFQVKELVREDRYEARGERMLMWSKGPNGWTLGIDSVEWDEEFEPYVYEKVGRRKTADEQTEQREWELLCYRPGTSRTPLDSYERVCDPFYRSTDRMERHY